jgi:hypothetical protein
MIKFGGAPQLEQYSRADFSIIQTSLHSNRRRDGWSDNDRRALSNQIL